MKKTKPWRIDAAFGVCLTLLFFILNRGAYQGFFQDDEFDTLSWIGRTPLREWVHGFFTPVFSQKNFRPVGHLYYLLALKAFGFNFQPYVFTLQLAHLLNVVLVWRLARKLGVGSFGALAGAAFFALNMAAIDAFWKPMYIFDVLCGTFCLASVLLFSQGRWVWSLAAFWLAFKAKEVAVMLPVVLAGYEVAFGSRRRWWILIPFFAVSLSFGVQAMAANRSRTDLYAFRWTGEAMLETAGYYSSRIVFIPYAGAALLFLPLLFRDRRVVWGVASMLVLFVPLLLLPGRVFCAYTYVPLLFLTIALAAIAGSFNPAFTLLFFVVWLPLDIRQLRIDRKAILAIAEESRPYFEAIRSFAQRRPYQRTVLYDAAPVGYHHWGVLGMFRCAYNDPSVTPLFTGSPEATEALRSGRYAVLVWDQPHRVAKFVIYGED